MARRGERVPAVAWLEAGVGLACALLALAVHRRALGGYFGLDDLVLLEKARGLIPDPLTPWRVLAGPVYWHAAALAFGARPLPYHVVNWLLHGLNTALVFALARRRGASIAGAALAAGLFGGSRLVFTAVFWPASVCELLALALTLAAMLAADRPGRAAAAAAGVAFAAALLCKESVMLLPLVLLLPRPGGPDARARLQRAAPLLALGALALALVVASPLRSTSLSGPAYATGFGRGLLDNLSIYVRWLLDLRDPFPDRAAAAGAGAALAGASLVAVGVAVAAWRRSSLPAFGALWWLLALAPVLPLLHHRYLHYLYAPLAGIALACGGALDLALGGRPATRPAAAAARAASGARRAGLAAAGVAAVLVIAHAAVSDALIERRLRLRMEGVDLALDPALARMEIARRAARGVREAVDDRPARIAILAPAAGRTWYSATSGAPTSTPDSAASHYDLYPAALDGGRALRALFPNVDSVAFVTRWSPAWRGFDLLMSDPDGTTRVFGRGATAYRRVGAVLINNGLPREAAEFLAIAVGEFPDDPALRWEYGLALARFGAREAALEQLRELIRRAPGDSLAARARAVLEAARPTPQPEGPRGR